MRHPRWQKLEPANAIQPTSRDDEHNFIFSQSVVIAD